MHSITASVVDVLHGVSPATLYAVGAGAVVLAIASKAFPALAAKSRQRRAEERLRTQTRGVVYLYQYRTLDDVLNISPFCGTIHTFLRLAKIPHEVVPIVNPNESPTGRLPYIELNGVGTADSDSILKRLAEVFPDKCGSNKATTLSLAVSHVVRKMLLRATRMHWMRWAWVDNAESRVRCIARLLPVPLVVARPLLIGTRKSTITYLNEEGHGDLSDAEYHAQFLDEMIALETLITDPGVQLTTEGRAAAYAVLEWLWNLDIDAATCPAVQHLKQSAKLQAFLRAAEAEAFPDMRDVCPKRPVDPFTLIAGK